MKHLYKVGMTIIIALVCAGGAMVAQRSPEMRIIFAVLVACIAASWWRWVKGK
jgi:hypothetical protein